MILLLFGNNKRNNIKEMVIPRIKLMIGGVPLKFTFCCQHAVMKKCGDTNIGIKISFHWPSLV